MEKDVLFGWKILLSLLSVIIFFSALEGFLRFTGRKTNLDLVRKEKEASRIKDFYLWKEELEIESRLYNKAKYEMNSQGLRGSRLYGEKGRETFRICCFGDSWTWGWRVEEKNSFPKQLEKILVANYPNMHLEVLNAGHPGNALSKILEDFQSKIEFFNPDLIIIWVGMNEGSVTITSYELEVFRKYNKIHQLIRDTAVYEILERAIGGFVNSLKDSAERKSFTKMYIKGFKEIKRITSAKGVPILVLNYPLPKEALNNINFPIHEAIRVNKMALVDLTEAFKEKEGLFLDYFFTHPNEKGYKLTAEIVHEAIKEMGIIKDN